VEIGPASGVGGPHPSGRKKSDPVQFGQDVAPSKSQDKVEFSPEARRMERIAQMTGIRVNKVQEICRQIARGEYETEEKWDVALGRLTQHILQMLAENDEESL